jgi:hypothetical protein
LSANIPVSDLGLARDARLAAMQRAQESALRGFCLVCI